MQIHHQVRIYFNQRQLEKNVASPAIAEHDTFLPRGHQHLHGHGYIDTHSHKETQGARRLGQWHLVGNGVKQTREEENPEVVESHLRVRVDSNI